VLRFGNSRVLLETFRDNGFHCGISYLQATQEFISLNFAKTDEGESTLSTLEDRELLPLIESSGRGVQLKFTPEGQAEPCIRLGCTFCLR